VQPSNVHAFEKEPKLVTESGIVIDVRLVQSLNAELPMVTTEFGMVTDVRLMQSWNAYEATLVTESGMSTCPLPSGVYAHAAAAGRNKTKTAKAKNTMRILFTPVEASDSAPSSLSPFHNTTPAVLSSPALPESHPVQKIFHRVERSANFGT